MSDTTSSVLTLIAVFLRVATGELYPSIQWTPTNPLFSRSKTQCVYPMSKVNFVCPNPAMIVGIQQDGTAKERMYENLWLVEKQSYDQCNVNLTNPKLAKLLLKCAKPLELKFYTVVFQKYSAQVGGPEYKPGKEYYFIATSDGTQPSLTDKSGGHCRTKNMRLEFHVCHNETDAHCDSPEKCIIREDPTEASPITLEKSGTAHTSTAAVLTTPTKMTGNNTKQDAPKNPDKSGTNATKYRVAIGMLAALTVLLLLATLYLSYRLRKQDRMSGDVHLREKLHSPTL